MNTDHMTLVPTRSSVPSRSTANLPLWSPSALPEFIKVFGSDVPAEPAHRLAATRIAVRRVIAGQAWVTGGRVRTPIAVRVDGAENASLVVAHESTGIYGMGKDLPSAVEDFRAALVEHFDVLVASQPLSEDLREQLAFLQRHLRPADE